VWKYSVDDVLVSGPEKWSYLRSVFWLFDLGMFIGIFGISIIRMPPFILSTKIVRVSIVIGDFIIFYGVNKPSNESSCR
jgi:cytochrome c oxidase assembly factor CtaG